VLREHGVHGVHGVHGIMHIAGKKQVGESVAEPLLYYRENSTEWSRCSIAARTMA